jgi:hypothetical protein
MGRLLRIEFLKSLLTQGIGFGEASLRDGTGVLLARRKETKATFFKRLDVGLDDGRQAGCFRRRIANCRRLLFERVELGQEVRRWA